MANHHHAPTSAPLMECARTQQIIAHFIHRSLHLILDARIPSAAPKPRPAAAAASRRKDKWFQLDLWDVLDASSSYPPWQHPILDPMLVDIVLLLDPDPDPDPDPYNPRPPANETVLERWVIQYEPLPAPTASAAAAAADAGVLLFRRMYKKMLILMRSLYSALRFLPAYRVYRMRRCGDFKVSYKVSNFGEPFTRAEEEGMRVQGFAPVEAAHGRVSVSVTYRASLSDLNFGLSSSYPPQIITDYVGSPAAEPIKIFHSSGAYYSSSTRGYRSTPSSASFSSPFIRPHSWTSGIHQPVPASSTPTHFSPPDIGGGRAAGYRPIPRKKAMNFDDQGFSPPFSPSPSPSTSPSPTSSPLYARLRSESTSTPVNIPLPMMGKGGGGGKYWSPNLSDPNKQFLPPPSPRSFKGENSSGSPSGSRSFRRLDGLRGAENYAGSSNLQGYGGQKLRDSKDDSGRFSGVVSSNGSPRIGFSRSSSRLSFQDDLDDCEFSCPFAVDDVIDTSETSHRTSIGKESGESSSNHALLSSRTSQDAAVGILVHMLKTAPPLRQDHSYISESSKSQYGEGGSSAFFMSRKTSDALEELRSYKEMKDLLLSQSGAQLMGSFKHGSNSLSE